MPTPNSGLTATLPDDVMLDTAVLYINDTVPFGATRGGLSFDPGTTRESLEFDGKYFNVVGHDRTTGGEPKITGTIIEYNAVRAAALEPGSASVTAGETGHEITTITPFVAGELYVEGAYMQNVRVAYRRGGGGFAVVELPWALATMWKVGPNSNKSEIQIEISGRQASDAANTGVVPFVVLLVKSLADLS